MKSGTSGVGGTAAPLMVMVASSVVLHPPASGEKEKKRKEKNEKKQQTMYRTQEQVEARHSKYSGSGGRLEYLQQLVTEYSTTADLRACRPKQHIDSWIYL
jgi:hypothetical protein